MRGSGFMFRTTLAHGEAGVQELQEYRSTGVQEIERRMKPAHGD
jgi:hypothetical protein